MYSSNCRLRIIKVALFINLALVIMFGTRAGAVSDDESKNCTECHPDMMDRFPGKHEHKPFLEEQCYSCHRYHRFTANFELKGRVYDFCTECHPEIVEIRESEIHEPVLDEESCALCHTPHRSDFPKLTRRPSGQICVDCHDGPDEMKGPVHKPYADLNCVSCHDPHGSFFQNQFKMPPGLICVSCHEAKLADYGPLEMHSAEELKSCENCHLGHGGGGGYLLRAEGSSLCTGCHRNLGDVADRDWPHEPVSEGECLDCHVPHFRQGASGLTAGQAELCGECHDLEGVGYRTAHLGLQPAGCAGCHDPHGSALEKFFPKYLHGPFADKECDTCHEDGTDLSSPDLCLGCHDEPEPTGGHAKELMGGSSCADCHSPHAAGSEYLLR